MENFEGYLVYEFQQVCMLACAPLSTGEGYWLHDKTFAKTLSTQWFIFFWLFVVHDFCG